MNVNVQNCLNTVITNFNTVLDLTTQSYKDIGLVYIDIAFASIRGYTNRDYVLGNYVDVYEQEHNSIYLRTPNVQSTTEVKILFPGLSEYDDVVLDSTQYTLLKDELIIDEWVFNDYALIKTPVRVQVSYTAGFTDIASNPQLGYAIMQQAIANYNRRDFIGVTREGDNTQAYNFFSSGSLLNEVKTNLAEWVYRGNGINISYEYITL